LDIASNGRWDCWQFDLPLYNYK